MGDINSIDSLWDMFMLTERIYPFEKVGVTNVVFMESGLPYSTISNFFKSLDLCTYFSLE
jgi:hypothetical protein